MGAVKMGVVTTGVASRSIGCVQAMCFVAIRIALAVFTCRFDSFDCVAPSFEAGTDRAAEPTGLLLECRGLRTVRVGVGLRLQLAGMVVALGFGNAADRRASQCAKQCPP